MAHHKKLKIGKDKTSNNFTSSINENSKQDDGTDPEEVFPIKQVDVKKDLQPEQLRILLKHVVIGCKIWVDKQREGEEKEQRLSEVLAIRNEKQPKSLQFYLHYCGFNKRLDEWVHYSNLDISKPIDYPKGYKSPRGGVEGSGNSVHREYHESQSDKSGPVKNPNLSRVRDNQNGSESPNSRKKDLDGTYWHDEEDKNTKRKERDHHASGSMTDNPDEISRLKNLTLIRMGKFEFEPWYFSPYPQEFSLAPVVIICEFCLTSYDNETRFMSHRKKCSLRAPPGNEIYRHEDISFFEIDGHNQKLYCRWLGLLSKLFLDHKTLYYDVDPFLFYIMTQNDQYGCHILGYFSKEKESVENYNLACILTLPQYQRKGYGRLLIQFSYELSKLEKKIGSPEKPLSDLGLLSYRAYWTDAIVAYLLEMRAVDASASASIEQISSITAIKQDDIVHTLTSIGSLKYYRSEFVLHLSDAVIKSYHRSTGRQQHIIQPSKISWTPYSVSASQLKYLN